LEGFRIALFKSVLPFLLFQDFAALSLFSFFFGQKFFFLAMGAVVR